MVFQAAAVVSQLPAADAYKSSLTAIAADTHNNKHALKIDFKSSSPISVAPVHGDFDTVVLAPLRAAQAAQAAAEAEAAAKAKLASSRQSAAVATQTVPVVISTGDIWEALRLCEAGGDYTKNTGNGYFGAYQYSNSTWAGFGGYARADLAPAAVQDAKARQTAAAGFGSWPACAAKLGLL